jgi:hypothetical protein
VDGNWSSRARSWPSKYVSGDSLFFARGLNERLLVYCVNIKYVYVNVNTSEIVVCRLKINHVWST